ncbi:MAG: proline--tRNA ligase [Deltaproteobacteria bacterium]|nr:proline--tRNA ligase [Candidatus Anaeroferrophillacea bacterium]
MRFSRFYLPTLKEDPAEAEVISHRLMLRAGMIRKLAAGIYSYLPLGLKAVQNVERIVRAEMDRAGAQELLLPGVQPAELWQESGRWERYGRELLRLKDRHGREFCLGPTHEEVITDLVRHEVRSYRQLPLNLYQVQTKFRDEIRPRFGLMRGREFVMKDAYSFDADDPGAEASYAAMRDAYSRIFRRCGLDFRAVEADSGAIGGSFSHEFVVLASSGEDAVATCTACDYAANIEKAERAGACGTEPESAGAAAVPALAEVETPGCRSIEDVCAFFGIEPVAALKSMVYESDRGLVLAVVTGDRQVSETKLKARLGVPWVQLAEAEAIRAACGAGSGFLGPVDTPLAVIADRGVPVQGPAVCGANRDGRHLRDVLCGRDFSPSVVADIVEVHAGDACPRCGGELRIVRGIEVGHIFKLGTKYSEAMGATFQDRDGEERPLVMGCYGIGIGRTVAAAIEQNHDDDGIIMPWAIAPFKVAVLCLDEKHDEVRAFSERLYEELRRRGIDVLLDDRAERPGIKFKDADLIGAPLRLTVGRKGYGRGIFEARDRRTRETIELPVDDFTPLWQFVERMRADDQGLPPL